MHNASFFLSRLFVFLIVFTGCGKSYNSDEFNRPDEEREEPQELQQNFRADLKSINPSVSSADGQVVIRLVEDDFRVSIAMRRVSATRHPQRILSGQNCPTLEADTSGDGIISAAELRAVSSTTFISLDGDPGDGREDKGSFPGGNFFGLYSYDENTSREELRTRLGRSFLLENRVVVVFGTDRDPTLPVSCGELTPITGSE